MVLKIECLEVLDPNKLYLLTHTENLCVCVTPTKGRCLANGGQSSDDVDFAYSGILPFKIVFQEHLIGSYLELPSESIEH